MNSRALWMSTLTLVALSCRKVEPANEAPTAIIEAPIAGQGFPFAEPIEFRGTVSDAEDALDALIVDWSSDLDGALSGTNAGADGVTSFTTANLSSGEHVVTLSVTDSAGESFATSLAFSVDAPIDGAPTIVIDLPGPSDEGRADEPSALQATVDDAEDALEDLIVDIESDLDGALCSPVPDSLGVASCDEALSIGNHTLTFTVTDSALNSASATVDYLVLDPEGIDDDGDGASESEGDCDDGNELVFPGADEVANGEDDNCNDLIDDGTSAYDDDGDGFSEAAGDCNDADKTIYTGAIEVVDGVDQDCDGVFDNGTSAFDDDGDGISEDEGDCDDTEQTVFPGAAEEPDGVDQNCNGKIDEGTSTYDGDGDCFCSGVACFDSSNAGCLSLALGDCDDTNNAVFTGATESCDAVDSNCNASLVDAFPNLDNDAQPDCVDLDDDNDGDPDVTDCDDANAAIYTGATESCDAIDSNCNLSLVDTFANFDGDAQPDCTDSNDDNDPDPDVTDCDDANAAIYTGATESCDAIDSNCNLSLVDTFPNFDGDAQPDCTDSNDDNDPDPDVTDCDDANAAIYTGAAESCDAIDSNCNLSLVDTFPNFDGDAQPDCTDSNDDNDPDPDVTDCNDANAAIYTGATELCDAIDSNCDTSLVDTFANFDGDAQPDCIDLNDDNDPDPDATDCNDASVTIYTGAAELCDKLDNDCDTVVDDGVAGTGAACAVASCSALHTSFPSLATSTYYIQGGTMASAVQMRCEMTAQGGGWTVMTPCLARNSFGGTLTTIVAGTASGVDPQCRPYGQDDAGAHAYNYTFNFPPGYTQFTFSSYVAASNAVTGVYTSDLGPAGLVTAWPTNPIGSTGDVTFGNPGLAGPTTSYDVYVAATGYAAGATIPWPGPANTAYSVGPSATQFRIGFGEGGGEFEGWYPWWSGEIWFR